MIISASRRTDIPSYYAEWFFNRIRERYVLVRNPVNPRRISRISLEPDSVDGIVFWTKNPIPMLGDLKKLRGYTYYFQFTVNAYGRDIEKNVPSKNDLIIPAFQRLSDMIGPDRVIWRYDPIFLSSSHTVDYHSQFFEKLARRLSGHTRKCTISFLDCYQKIKRTVGRLSIQTATPGQQDTLVRNLAEIAHHYGLQMDTCAEEGDFQKYGVQRARCIDDRLFEKLLGCPLEVRKDRNQRLFCGCIESIDIGAYNTCKNGCCYCYANLGEKVMKLAARHDPCAPLLTGTVGENDTVTERKARSCLARQRRLYG